MTSDPSSPPSHRATLRAQASDHHVFTCCGETDSRFFTMWRSTSTAQSRFAVLGTPAEVFENIANHVTHERNDDTTRTAMYAARTVVALSDDTVDGIRILHENLDYVSVEFSQ